MTMIEKNEISHRGKAINNLIISIKNNCPEYIIQQDKEMA